MRLLAPIVILFNAASVFFTPSIVPSVEATSAILPANQNHTIANITSRPPTKAIGRLICDQIDWHGWANREHIDEGIAYLRGRGAGLCGVGPGPRACRRVSCSYNSAIWACNDEPVELAIPWALLAQYAQHVQNHCYLDTLIVAGQVFDDGQNYNVVIGEDDC